jgi:hypothetical protein
MQSATMFVNNCVDDPQTESHTLLAFSANPLVDASRFVSPPGVN